MIVYERQQKKRQCGTGLVNSIINKLPIELHVPGYQYCGPGTKLQKRLARGDPGINPLDAACKEHDIAYSQNRENLAVRHEADRVLAEKAWRRVLAKDASIAEKAVAWGVANTMKAKSKLGMGARTKRTKSTTIKKKKKSGSGCKPKSGTGCKRKTKSGAGTKKKSGTGSKKKKKSSIEGSKRKVPLQKIITAAQSSMVPGIDAMKTALKGAREAVKQVGGKEKIRALPRILPVPAKIGGFLPAFLIPLFAGLSATGALAGGAAGIAKAVNDAKGARTALEESKRHNATMEAIALGKGLYLKPYKTGLGLHLRPPKNT